MRTISNWLDAYGVSHKNSTNKLIHWICIPAIMFSLFGLLYSIPFPMDKTVLLNWATLFLLFTLGFYLRLSFSIFVGFVGVSAVVAISVGVGVCGSALNSGIVSEVIPGIRELCLK